MVNRIRELLDIRQLSPTQFADFIGVGRPVISHILSERNKPSLEVVQKVISAFPDVSLAWLMSGTGPMLASALPAAAPPAPPLLSTAPAASAIDSNHPAPVLAPPAPVSPSLATPAHAVAIAPVPAPLPVATTILAAAQPTQLPQPPKFRPGTKAASGTGPSATMAAVESPIAPLVNLVVPQLVATPATAPVTVPAPGPAMSSGPSVAALAGPPVAPAYAESPIVAPAAPAASAPLSAKPTESGAEVVPNPAAAFSFLGEAGKTIRRIVLFYNDGSFSDYRPEE